MYPNHGTDVIEPVELFLSRTIDADRLAMYQDAIDLAKLQEKYSVMDTINSIIPNSDDESPADIEMLIYNSLARQFRDLLGEYDVIVSGGSLPFLTKLLRAVNLIDQWDQSQAFIDIATNDDYLPKYRLYQLITAIDKFDEEEYSGIVQMVSMSLLERITEVHQQKVLEEDDTVSTESIDLSVLRKVGRNNNDLLLNRMLNDNKVKNILPVPIINSLFVEYYDAGTMDAAQLAKELIAVYLISGQTGPALIKTISDNLPTVVSDDLLISKTTILLGRVYQEMTA
jgi:hypothetical protein